MLATLPLMGAFWAMAAIGTSFTGPKASSTESSIGGYVSILALHMFVLVFSVGINSTPWIISTEIFPLHLIGTGNSLATTSNWICNALIAQVFRLVSEANTLSTVVLYLTLGAVALGTFFFVYYLVPETACKPIESNLNEIVGKGYQKREQEMLATEIKRQE